MRLLQRLRGVFGMAVTWAAGFGALGGAVALGLRLVVSAGLTLPPQMAGHMASVMLSIVARYGLIGFGSGATFALAIVIAERRQTISSLSPGRIARWGVLAGLIGGTAVVALTIAWYGGLHIAPQLLASLLVGAAAVTGLLGLGAARASLRIARHDEVLE
jgi:hypothetical protein